MGLNFPTPAIIAHRGASASAPENTLAAFQLALYQGADGIELDVHLTKDRQVVVLHDSTLDRTTSGQGLVHETLLADLRTLDAGNGERIPTLAGALALIEDRALLNIELKGFSGDNETLPEKVAAEVAAAGLSETIIYSSFDPRLLSRIQQIEPNAKIGLLLPPGLMGRIGLWLVRPELKLYSLHPHFRSISARMLRRAHQKGLKVFPYTVNDPMKARSLFAGGIDGIITDDPAAARIIRDRWEAA